MKMAFQALPLLLVARGAARRAQALAQVARVAAPAEPLADPPGDARANIELVRRYVRR
jgi:hypothetical protein